MALLCAFSSPCNVVRLGTYIADKPGVANLIDILAVATQRTPEEIEAAYDGSGYGDLKRDVGDAVVDLLDPVRERYLALRADEPELLRLLAVGADKARAASAPTLEAMTGYDTEAVLLQAQRLVPLAGSHRLAPTNPVFVVSGVLT